ncbi:MAG: hypothetical protein VYE72_04815, partial [Candidatus Thermoplasmatota archaeon]|nr:hypothetical protein [Candidatus Thermoplasmatota archaeon]
MGLDMIGLLVHKPTLLHLLSLSWGELKSKMERAALRDLRPAQDNMLKTQFAIDAEADLLDWMDEQSVNAETHAGTVLANLNDGEEGLLNLMQWASPGRWEVWEGRAFLYLENATGAEAEDIHALYTEATWTTVLKRLHGISEDEYAERVVMDWMDR